MINEEEKLKYVEATKCTKCTQWHHHCNAECCRSIVLNISPKQVEESGSYVSINPGKVFTFADARYYKYHNVEYMRGFLRFRKDRIHIFGNKVLYIYDCEKLDGNMCTVHEKNKPDICKFLTLETVKANHNSFCTTPNCLFKFKVKEVKQND